MSMDLTAKSLAYLDAIAALDGEAMRRFLADNARCWVQSVGWMEPAGLIALLTGAKPLLADGMKFTHYGTLVDGNQVALQVSGDSPLIKGGAYVNEYCFVFTFGEDGKIIETREYTDSAPAAAAFSPAD